jgi:cytochrome c oxidase subunit II
LFVQANAPQRVRLALSAARRGRAGLIGAAIIACALLLGGCADSAPSPANPSSPRAEQLNHLWWLFLAMAAVIFVIVVAILVYGAVRRPEQAEQQRDHPFGTPLLWIGGITVPAIVLGVIFLLSTRDLAAVAHQPAPQLTIEVTGHQWWWEVRYPQQGFVTANEIHIPAGQQVEVKLTANDVIHDFWVPELQGKIDTIPGETNTLTLETSKPGTYRGECLVFCGLQHANMNFIVIVDPPAQFAAWVARQQQPAGQPTDAGLAKGAQLFMSSSCVYCHGVAGTSASAVVGPDLTHFGSREQIGAGALPNTPAALRAWIANPQVAKPGTLMPAEQFSDADLDALVGYLESLK